MPRPNKPRSVFAEQYVAEHVRRERGRHGWTYEGLAKRMADHGCPIQPSAIFKLEKADPPRRVTVDELVAFSKVFEIPMAELVRDPEIELPRQIAELHEEMLLANTVRDRTRRMADEAQAELERIWEELGRQMDRLPEAERTPEKLRAILGPVDEVMEAIGPRRALIDQTVEATSRRLKSSTKAPRKGTSR